MKKGESREESKKPRTKKPGVAQERMRLMQQCIDHASDAVFWVDKNARFLYVNEAACHHLGYSRNELLSMDVYTIDPTYGKEKWSHFWLEAKTKGSMLFETTNITKEGRQIPVEIAINFLEDGDRELVHGYVRDISERKASEKRMQLMSLAMEQCSEGIAIGNFKGDLLYLNKAFSQAHGYEPHEIIGKNLCLFHTQEQIPSVEEANRQLRETGRFIGEIWHVRRDGTVFPALMNNSLLLDENGNPTAMIGTLRDITDLKHAHEALRASRDRLEQKVEQRTLELQQANTELLDHREKLRNLASQLSLAEERERRRIAGQVHDHIGQNLAFAKIKFSQLKKDVPPDRSAEVSEIVKLIDQTIEDTRFLVSELANPVLYELGLVPAIQWLAQQTQRKTGLNVEFQDDGRPKPVSDDLRIFLFQAVRELLTNVAKHAEATHCTVSIRVDQGRIRVDVTDDGIGFGAKEIDTAGGEEKSFGFFSIRERLGPLGGWLGIHSKPNEGTRITLFAPLNK
jgi:PAS domain S-box-containing protein